MRAWLPAAALFGVLVSVLSLNAQQNSMRVRVGSKKFTESVILAEMIQLLAKGAGADVSYSDLGGTIVLWQALVNGQCDIYPEYTGTITEEIFAGERLRSLRDIRDALARKGIRMTEPLGFSNNYALGMKRERASALNIRTISDLIRYPDLRFGWTNEFMERADGWPGVRDHYGLPQRNVRGLAHDVAYRGLENGDIDVIDLYSTDAEIRYYDLLVLEDDLNHFPRYDAVILYRDDLRERASGVVRALHLLQGLISEDEMVALNGRVKLDQEPERRVAAEFLEQTLGVKSKITSESVVQRILRLTWDHLTLVGISMLGAIVVAIPMGIWAAKSPTAAPLILGAVGVLQTVPSLALLVLLMLLLNLFRIPSLGSPPAILALFLYSLLPIVRNTHTGLQSIPATLRESAIALGLPAWSRLWMIELPLASRTILAGIKTATVINVGFATLGAFVGAGGYGQVILTGLRLARVDLILQGAVPAAVLALLAQALFDLVERFVVPKGLLLE